MTPRHLESTRAQRTPCPGCGTPTLTAIDEGVPARADPTPLTPGEEPVALLAGRRTYTLTTSGYLIHRIPAHIRTGRPHGTVHAQHQCPTPTLDVGLHDMLTHHTQQRRAQYDAGIVAHAHDRATAMDSRTAGKAARHSTRQHPRST